MVALDSSNISDPWDLSFCSLSKITFTVRCLCSIIPVLLCRPAGFSITSIPWVSKYFRVCLLVNSKSDENFCGAPCLLIQILSKTSAIHSADLLFVISSWEYPAPVSTICSTQYLLERIVAYIKSASISTLNFSHTWVNETSGLCWWPRFMTYRAMIYYFFCYIFCDARGTIIIIQHVGHSFAGAWEYQCMRLAYVVGRFCFLNEVTRSKDKTGLKSIRAMWAFMFSPLPFMFIGRLLGVEYSDE